MGKLIDDDILDDLRRRRRARHGRRRARCAASATSSTALSFYAPYKSAPDTWLPVIAALQAG